MNDPNVEFDYNELAFLFCKVQVLVKSKCSATEESIWLNISSKLEKAIADMDNECKPVTEYTPLDITFFEDDEIIKGETDCEIQSSISFDTKNVNGAHARVTIKANHGIITYYLDGNKLPLKGNEYIFLTNASCYWISGYKEKYGYKL